MRAYDIIQQKRDGHAVSEAQLQFLIDGLLAGTVSDYQLTAFLMAVYFKGMQPDEVVALTKVMLHSGIVVDLSHVPGVKADKHSTGGVGDKISLPLAPAVAACGVPVPMISGRGLGHTGGTLDKLESIPGFRVDLDLQTYQRLVGELGCCLIGQTKEVAPADKRLYALRDVTATVDCIPLIASSIMSKKLAVGLDALVLDVKVGSGAFMKKQVDARRLAQLMVAIGRRHGKRVQALITDMNQPLGYAIGNALEIMEVSQTLQNGGPIDLTRLSIELAARMIHLGKIVPTIDEARDIAQRRLVDGSAYKKLKEVIKAQGGDPNVLDKFELLPNATGARDIVTTRGGYVSAVDAQVIGSASTLIGAGRNTKDDVIDHAVGVILEVKVGQKIDPGTILCRLYYRDETNVEEAADLVEDAFRISASAPDERENILEVVS
jgi:pyrimidine-nucleoside phosphorylase